MKTDRNNIHCRLYKSAWGAALRDGAPPDEAKATGRAAAKAGLEKLDRGEDPFAAD